MSTVEQIRTRKTFPPLVAGEHLDQPTFHERYAAMPPETRAELVDGVVYMPSPLSYDHGEEDNNVAGWLFYYKVYTPGVHSPNNATVKLDARGEPQPDCQLFIPAELGGQVRIDEQGYITGAPELIVETARSSRQFDLNQKKGDYERAGVLEYVVVELDPDQIHWFIRRGDRFEDLLAGPDGIYRSEAFPGLWLDAGALYAEDLTRLIQVLDQGLATPEHAAFAAKLAEARRRAGGATPDPSGMAPPLDETRSFGDPAEGPHRAASRATARHTADGPGSSFAGKRAGGSITRRSSPARAFPRPSSATSMTSPGESGSP